jgi:hypothetical protein
MNTVSRRCSGCEVVVDVKRMGLRERSLRSRIKCTCKSLRQLQSKVTHDGFCMCNSLLFLQWGLVSVSSLRGMAIEHYSHTMSYLVSRTSNDSLIRQQQSFSSYYSLSSRNLPLPSTSSASSRIHTTPIPAS